MRKEKYGSFIYISTKGLNQGQKQSLLKSDKKTDHMLFSGGAHRSSVLFSYKEHGTGNDDYLYGLKWGTDIESAYKKILKVYSKADLIEEFEIVREDRGVFGVVKDFEGRKDVSCQVVLECKNNDTLTAVDKVYTIGGNSTYTADKLQEELYNELIKKYGLPDDDKYGYEWQTENSKIFLVTADEENVVLSYAQIDW